MKLIIACTNKKRGLKDSKYNERRAECEQAVKDIGNISFLGELTPEEFEDIKDKINNEVNKNVQDMQCTKMLVR